MMGRGTSNRAELHRVVGSLRPDLDQDHMLWWDDGADDEWASFARSFRVNHPIGPACVTAVDPLIYCGRLVNVLGMPSSMVGGGSAYDLVLDPERATVRPVDTEPEIDDRPGRPILDMTAGVRWHFGTFVLAAIVNEADYFGLAG